MNNFPRLCFPLYDFRLRKENKKVKIFDEVRKLWLVCTPEEWGRQNLIKFLINELKFPQNFIAIEKSIELAGRIMRFDALVYSPSYQPLVIIETKSPTVAISQKVFDQILNYNYEIAAKYFLITNGLTFIMGKCSRINGVEFLKETVEYKELI